MFIDTATISVRAGRGGDGAISFHREKYVAAGGPDGGDGGRGGHVIISVDEHMSTLMDFSYKRKYAAENGENGNRRQRFGKDGEDLILRVPRGTLIYDDSTGALLCDMSEPFLLCRGGRGGWGNKHFATPTRQAPRFAKAGLAGEEKTIRLELKLLADVGLIGFPNVGKSTLLSVISSARPKIAGYHFTTLTPNLGVVRAYDETFVCADIPGLIEGASDGAGLGHDFLRHVERCRLLLHLVDISGSEGRDPLEDYDIINGELARHSPVLAKRKQIVLANKCDLLPEDEAVERLRERVENACPGTPVIAISAATRAGIDELISKTLAQLRELPPIEVYEPDPVVITPVANTIETEIANEDGIWVISGAWLDSLVRDINFSDQESLAYFEKRLKNGGVYDKLEELGVNEGDTIDIYGMQFDYIR